MNYKVGQVVYLLSPKTLKILPALIVEEITRKTVEDVKTQYVLQMPDKNKTNVVLGDVTAEIFNDIETLRNHMIENTRLSVEKLISLAIEMKENVYGESFVDISSNARANDVMDLFVKKDKSLETKTQTKEVQTINDNKDVQKSLNSVIIKGEAQKAKDNNTQQAEAK
jgi:hypothetical protein